MKRMLAMLGALLATTWVVGTASAAAKAGTEVEAQAMVKKAVAFYEKNGREKAFTEFQKSPGPFVDRDLYITVYDLKGRAMSHINPKMIGKDLIDLRDPDGVYIVRGRIEAASKAPSGWQEYKFFNPVSKKVEPKRMYWERHDDLLFACGVYKN